MIETLEDWNARLSGCGCCPMPECPEFSVVQAGKYGMGQRCSVNMWNEILESPTPSCTNLRGTWSSAVRVVTEDNPPHESTRTRTVSRSGANQDCSATLDYDGFPTNYEAFATRISRAWSGGTLTEVWRYVNTSPDPDETSTYTLVETYSGFLSEEDSLAATLNNATLTTDADTWSDDSVGSSFPVARYVAFIDDYLTSTCPPVGVVTRIDLYKKRFRFRIPNTHLGSKFTITYDVAEFPEDEEVDPSFVSQDNVVEWTGPGNQEDPDGDSWLTPWVELNPPEISGERRIVNIRYTCYSGDKFGVKPQVMGEAFEPPAP
jgi:hypothetical protein